MFVSQRDRVNLSRDIASEILDEGLGKSTFKDNFPAAYLDLLTYREDMEQSITAIIEKKMRGDFN